jgi:hypothetical protein
MHEVGLSKNAQKFYTNSELSNKLISITTTTTIIIIAYVKNPGRHLITTIPSRKSLANILQ